MVFLQSLDLSRLAEVFFGLADAVQRAIFDERLGGLGDQRQAGVRVQGCAGGGHGPADAMAERDEVPEIEALSQQREVALRLVPDEVGRPAARVSVGASVA
ncbi:hypothetical protein FQZ97_1134820 [compost metagenome]